MTLYKWSQTASADATADSTINWAEGQSPSSINDSARAMMAATAKYRDDIAGAIVTGGTSTAYAVSSYEVFDTLAHLNGQMIAFTPHTTNGATVTLNVDALGAKPLRSAPNVELSAGTIIQGTPYAVTYNNSDGAFYLHGFFGNPYLIPIGGSIEFWGPTAPNSSLAFPFGQAISRTTYSTLFSIVGTTYGTGDGSTTFNLPDCRGRVVAGKDDMGGAVSNPPRLTSTYFGAVTGATGTTLGAFGGSESTALTLGQLPTGITSAGTVSVTSNVSGIPTNAVAFGGQRTDGSGTGLIGPNGAITPVVCGSVTSTGNNTLTSNNTNGNPHLNVQPTIVANKLIRII